MKATKDYKLLSFGDEAEEEEVVLKDVQVTFLINKKNSYEDLASEGKYSTWAHLQTQSSVSIQANGRAW